jgi:flagellar motor switch protein FliM
MSDFSTINTWFSYRKAGAEEETFDRMKEGISHAPLRSIAYVAETSITGRQFMNLKPGDVLRTNKSSKEPMLMKVNGKPKFYGHPGTYKGKKAMRITSTAPIDAEINRAP